MNNAPTRLGTPSTSAPTGVFTGWILPTVSGLLFVGIFWFGYQFWKPVQYEARDDGIITMSHGRNLAEFGTIGVNPAGERVEGYSAPVQMFTYFVCYKLFEVSYEKFSFVQTYISSFFLGFIFFLFFKERPRFALAAATVAGLFLTRCYSFSGWHASGMENPFTHVLLLLSVYLLYRMYTDGRAVFWYAAVLFLASISRVDSVWHVAPVAAVFSLMWITRWHNYCGVWITLLFMGAWVLFQVWRYYYFGALTPNTGVAQSIDMGERMRLLAHLDREVLDQSTNLAMKLFARHNAYLLLISLPPLLVTSNKGQLRFGLAVVLILYVTSFLTPFVFGRARLDAARTTTHLALFCILGVSWMLSEVERFRHYFWAVPLVIAVGIVEMGVHDDKPRYLCCDADRFDRARLELTALGEREKIYRPKVATADLGVMSWHKIFNILDLGYLGSPVVADLRDEPAALADYFFEFAAPDLVEMHGFWSCTHHYIMEDARFKERYKPVRSKRDSWLRRKCGDHPDLTSGVWVRRDMELGSSSKERRLMEALEDKLDLSTLSAEVETCSSKNQAGACLYAVRTAYRFLPEFREAGKMEEMRAILAETDDGRFVSAILRSGDSGNWHRRLAVAVRERTWGARSAGRASR